MKADDVPPSFSIRLLGPLEVRVSGQPLPRLRFRKSHALLALLALRGGAPVERDWLLGLLWPEGHRTQGLRNALSSLRQALGPEAVRLVSPTPRILALDLTGAFVDVLAFDAALARGDPEALEEAVALYRGPLLEGWSEEWVFLERQVREQGYLAARERLATLAFGRGEAGEAERHLRLAIAADPLRESAQRGLMGALAAQGSYAAALLCYRELRLRLHRELNAGPDPETQALFRRLREEARARTMPAARLGTPASDPLDPTPPVPEAWHRTPDFGTLTFLFTDIEESTQLWEEHPEAMQPALARHDRLLRETVEQHAGTVFKSFGDQCCAVFSAAPAALTAALAAQQSLQAEPWEKTGPLRVRMALHTGTAQMRDGDYFGPTLNRLARLLELGHGGQVLLSRAAQELVRDHLPPGADLLDLGEHWLPGLVRPEQVFQLFHPDLAGQFPPLRGSSRPAHNLPAPPTALLGRAAPVAELRRWLSRTDEGYTLCAGTRMRDEKQPASSHPPSPWPSPCRLVTLTGPGGVGKSRLALQVAAELIDSFADGVFLIELAPLRDPQLVGVAVAQVLEVRETGSGLLMGLLKRHLRDRRLLLVFDNFEHLLPAAALVAELLAAAPGLKVLITSRAPLQLRGEKEYPVPPLAVPGVERIPYSVPDKDGSAFDPAGYEIRNTQYAPRLMEYAAVQLFLQRAQEVRPDFVLTHENAPAVVEICRRLDGLPLALELAAARVRALPVGQIAARLGDRFRLLTGGSRSALPRQQTLQGLIDWSYELLSQPEQALLRQLSVFAGGWTLEAAEAVCSDFGFRVPSGRLDFGLPAAAKAPDDRPSLSDPIQNPNAQRAPEIQNSEVLDPLTHLVEHSLVLYEEQQGMARYRLLETIREYARERGEAEPEVLRAVADRHARFYLAFAEARLVRMRTRDQVQALDELEPELDNLRVAMDGAHARQERELCARLALALYYPLYGQGFWEEAEAHLRAGLAALGEPGSDPAALRAALQYHLASLAEDRGDLEGAQRQAEASLALRREAGDRSPIAETLNLLGKLAIRTGDPAAARRLLDEALPLLDEGDPVLKGKLLHNLGGLAADQGDVARARRLYHEGLAELRRAGDPHDEARLLGDLGALAQHDGDDAEARRLYLDALAAYRQLRDRHGIAVMLNNLGELDERAGHPERAVGLFLHAERIFRELHSAFVTEPAASLARMARQWSPDRWEELREAAEGMKWEELVRPGAD